MAKATYNEGERIVTVADPTITLTLSIAEAEMVRSLAGSVNLNESVTAEEAQSVYNALSKHLRGFAKHKPTELRAGYKSNNVVWTEK